MKIRLPKIPDQIVRLAIVFLVLIGAISWIWLALPPSLKERKLQRAAAVERERDRAIRYAGSAICAACHPAQYAIKKAGYHQGLSCETCHGPAAAHTRNPAAVKPQVPTGRKFCPLCHAYNPSRPVGFPQINPVVHNPLVPCTTCHNPHDPKPPRTPESCAACHRGFARQKAVSPHALLECTTCHTAPEAHKITPWIVPVTKPSTREFCGQCHSKESKVAGPPKIDLATHGEKYLCWQCHYPHMPAID
jgi:ribosomal protein S27AE